MKKAFSLIELVFSIVIIGLCLATLPRIVEISLKSDEFSYKQEYFYALKEFYGVIKSLPLDAENICRDEFKNSLLSQYCINSKDVSKYRSEPDLDLINKTSRFGKGNERCKGCTYVNGLDDIKSPEKINFAIWSNNTTYDPKSRFDHTFVRIEKDNSYSIKEGRAGNVLATDTIRGYKISIIDEEDDDTIGVFHVFYPRFGRVENIYSEYLLHTDDARWNEKINKELDIYLNFNQGVK